METLLMETVEQVLTECIVKDNLVLLPNQMLERPLYDKVKKRLEGIGGKWNTRQQGFVFESDPSDLLAEVACGAKINLKKEYQFFPTPPDIAYEIVLKALSGNLTRDYETTKILEPSAGKGALIEKIHEIAQKPVKVYAIELMEDNRKVLEKIPNIKISKTFDFLELNTNVEFDVIIANPPFTKNQDIDHIRKMFEVVKIGGRIVTLASQHWMNSKNKKEKAFYKWLLDINATIEMLPSGSFKESGTMIDPVVVIINKVAGLPGAGSEPKPKVEPKPKSKPKVEKPTCKTKEPAKKKEVKSQLRTEKSDKSTEGFKKIIADYLGKFASENELFAVKYENPEKNIEDCTTYILSVVQKSGKTGFADDEVFSMAVHYYQEDNIDIKKESKRGVTIVTNIEQILTPEEIKEQKQKAMDQVLKQETDRIKGKNASNGKTEVKSAEQADLFK